MTRSRTDSRSDEARAYRALYKTTRWIKGRLAFLRQHPLCERCQAEGRVTAASVVDHIKPHKGDVVLFFDPNNWQSLCKPCHDGPKKFIESRGFDKTIGLDGFPVDPRHPSRRGE